MSKYIGYKGISNNGCGFEVVSKGAKKDYFVVKFDNNYEAEYQRTHIKQGNITNPYKCSVEGVGYLGVGCYKVSVGGKHTKEYRVWKNMLYRSYNKEFQICNPTYAGCSVDKDWHNFQNFAAWYTSHKNYGKKDYQMDKDLKIIPNKVYSPDTCDIIPSQINSLLLNSVDRRGSYIVGVSFNKSAGRYNSYCCILLEDGESKNKNLGYFNTEQEAFFAYKKAKEKNVKRVANLYKDEICIEIYNNLMNWAVPVHSIEFDIY